jgi:hypothetical protein
MNATAAVRQDDFDTVLLSELEILRKSEQHLERLYRQLQRKPHLRDSFLCELSEVQQRTERLNAVLTPFDAFELPVAAFGGVKVLS